MADAAIEQALSRVSDALRAERSEPKAGAPANPAAAQAANRAAWDALSPFAPRIAEDKQLASGWLTLLRITPARPGLASDVQRILSAWPDDHVLVLAGCDALVRSAELRAIDEPPRVDGPETLAAAAAQRCLTALPEAARKDAAIGGYLQMARANALRLAHRYDEALDAYQAALATNEQNGDWWFNLGLLHKAKHDWQPALEANQRARKLLGERRGVLWNIAICATALGRGELAAEVFGVMKLRVQITASGMPFVEGLPPVQVRVATLGSGHGSDEGKIDRAVTFELLWVTPLSPCHGVIETATYREASVDAGDLVLWDGTPVGMGEHDGMPVPRFALLSVLRKGDERRFRFVALEQEEGDLRPFGENLPSGARMFVHHAKVENLCARCASGDHMRKHEHTEAEPHRLSYGKVVIPGDVPLDAFQGALGEHLKAHPKVQLVMPALLEALGQTQAAGKAHQMWRGLERTAMKTATTGTAPRA